MLANGTLARIAATGEGSRRGPFAAGQVLVGAVLAGLASYFSVKWLTRCFETRTLIPFAIYSLLAGTICIIRFG